MTNGELVPLLPSDVGPGLVPTGFAESLLERAAEVDDVVLWNTAVDCAGLAQRWNGHGQEKKEIKTAQMFLEVELGQRLGPPQPLHALRSEAGQFAPDSHANPVDDLPIPPPRVAELRRYYGHRNMLIEAVRNGATSRRSLLLAVDQFYAAEHPEPTVLDVEIRGGDFRDVLGDLEPRSVALVLTDPPYPAEYLPLWSDLGKWSERALVDGGSLVAYCGQSIMPDAIARLNEHLRYWWTIALTHSSGSQMLPGKFVSVGWKPLLWYVNERRRDRAMVPDRIAGSTPRKTVPTGDDGTWAQSVDELEPIISALTGPGDLIVDPFAGSGTVGMAAVRFGRRFVGATL